MTPAESVQRDEITTAKSAAVIFFRFKCLLSDKYCIHKARPFFSYGVQVVLTKSNSIISSLGTKFLLRLDSSAASVIKEMPRVFGHSSALKRL